MTTEDKIKVMQAYIDGKEIQCRSILGGEWGDAIDELRWNWDSTDYRIKPNPREYYLAYIKYPSGASRHYVYHEEKKAYKYGTPFGGSREIIKVREVFDETL